MNLSAVQRANSAIGESGDQTKKIDHQQLNNNNYMKMSGGSANQSPSKGQDENVPPSARSGIAPINTKVGAAATGGPVLSKIDLDKRGTNDRGIVRASSQLGAVLSQINEEKPGATSVGSKTPQAGAGVMITSDTGALGIAGGTIDSTNKPGFQFTQSMLGGANSQSHVVRNSQNNNGIALSDIKLTLNGQGSSHAGNEGARAIEKGYLTETNNFGSIPAGDAANGDDQ